MKPLEHGEVIGLSRGGTIIQWDARGLAHDSGVMLVDFDQNSLTDVERRRLRLSTPRQSQNA
jgi:hypothetical protein